MVKSVLLAAILKNELYFVSAVVHISRTINGAVHHCACNPLSQDTAAHIPTVAEDEVICLGRQSCRTFLLLVRTSISRLLSANSTQCKSFRVKLKMANSKWTL